MEQNPSPFRSFVGKLTRGYKIKVIDSIDSIVKSFSITEKALFLLFVIIFAWGALSILGNVSDSFSVYVPKHGGSLIEGIVGTPRFVNPLLAASDADRDLTELVYSGLLKSMPDGTTVPDLAQSYTVSPDGLTYSVVIRPDARWSDGTQVTADDVAYTVEKAQDPTLKSPRFVNWQGVSVQKTGDKSVVFVLKQPYAPFINNLTLGIMPSHLWKDLTSDQMPFSSQNTAAVGSGPFIISSVIKSSSGIPTEFILRSNPDYAGGEPYIANLYIKSFADEKSLVAALTSRQIDSASNLSPDSAKEIASAKSAVIMSAPLTRVFGIFFNQNQDQVLANKEVRQALNASIDKDALINSVLQGYGTAIDGPLPATVADQLSTGSDNDSADASTTLANAVKALAKAGWKKNPSTGIYIMVKGKGKTAATTTLAVTISTANVPELVLAGKKIEDIWNNFGVKADLQVYDPSDLNQSVIRPRKYDALLFGLVTGKNSDLYSFWHSSQRNDPGLNIAMYTNKETDKLLEGMRTATSSSTFAADYNRFAADISNDVPAIFLWSPDFIYAVPARLHGVDLGEITNSSDRFFGIEKWYIETDHVWSAFVKDKDSIIGQ